MKRSSHLIVADVGGSKTSLLSIDKTRRKSTSKIFPTDLSLLKKRLNLFIGHRHKPEKLWVGMRGVWTPSEKRKWSRRFKGLAQKVEVLSDIELAHRLAFQGEPGIVLNAGTGSIAFGVDQKGQTARAGGWGPLLGDEGSAFWMGREYLRRKYSKGGDFLKIRRLAVGENPVVQIAGLAKTVLAASGRDAASRAVLNEAYLHLKKILTEVNQSLKLKPPVKLRLTGGLFRHPRFRNGFVRRLGKRFELV